MPERYSAIEVAEPSVEGLGTVWSGIDVAEPCEDDGNDLILAISRVRAAEEVVYVRP